MDTTHTNISMEKISSLHSICMNKGAGDAGICIISLNWVNPIGMPRSVEAIMLRKIAPFTLQTISKPAISTQTAKSCFSGSVTILANETMAAPESVIPALLRPSEARKKPTPTAVALRSERGMHSIIR